jgi:hypothetical protein
MQLGKRRHGQAVTLHRVIAMTTQDTRRKRQLRCRSKYVCPLCTSRKSSCKKIMLSQWLIQSAGSCWSQYLSGLILSFSSLASLAIMFSGSVTTPPSSPSRMMILLSHAVLGSAGNTWLLCGIHRELKTASISWRDVDRLSLLNTLDNDACPTSVKRHNV